MQSYEINFTHYKYYCWKIFKSNSVSGSGATGVGQLSFADAGGGKINQVLNYGVTCY